MREPMIVWQAPLSDSIKLRCAAAAFGTPSAKSIGLAAGMPSRTIWP